MKIITSKDNSIYKKCIQLSQKKYRDKYGEFLAEGEKIVAEAKNAGRTKCIIASSCYVKNEEFLETDLVFMMGKLFNKIAQTETSQGIAAIVSKGSQEDFQNAISQNDQCNIVVLDRLQDPGNIGTIIRTAEAAGYKGVVTIKGTCDVYSPKVVRAAAGSLLRMPIWQGAETEEVLRYLKEQKKKIATTSLEADKYFYQVDLEKNIALVIGNEGNGVSQKMQEESHLNIKIPMNGETESLNAAVAAGIIMYQSVRKG